jgi:hypothetical protein
MSAAATAAGYLYASGRLRGREKREEGAEKPQKMEQPKASPEVRVAAIPAQDDRRPRRTPVVQYRTRRWKPEGQ